MSDDLLRRALDIFADAVELTGDERHVFLANACGTEVVLRAEVDKLLSSDEAAWPDVASSAPHIPGYSIIELLGEGGMGAVYLAEQHEPQRRVALKVLRSETASAGLVGRFRREARLLARLQHRGIAQIFETGLFQNGRVEQPFLAMELVAGLPITECRAARERDHRVVLELIAQVCDAVEHAHEQGIIHRDLKPANILVTESKSGATAKILDFGIARTIGGEAASATLQTMPGQIIGTLAYMSPEQLSAASDDLGPGCDVYALGVLLYELLSGELPLKVAKLTMVDAAKRIREDEPTGLSSIRPEFRGDIETIVQKALEKDPARRYESSQALAADIRNHLQSRAIAARPASTFYQLRKFAARHRGLVSGAAFAFGALIVGLGFAIRYGLLEASQRRRAEVVGYRASLGTITMAFESGVVAGMNEMLDEVPEHLRGWEWRHLRSRATRHRWQVDAYSTTTINKVRVAFSQDSARVISQIDEHTIGIWSTERGALLHTVDLGKPIKPVALSSGPGGVAALLVDDTLVLFEDRTGSITHREQIGSTAAYVDWNRHSGLLTINCLNKNGAGGTTLVGTPGKLAVIPSLTYEKGNYCTKPMWTSGGAFLTNARSDSRGQYLRGFRAQTWEELANPIQLLNASSKAASSNPGTSLIAIGRDREVFLFGIEDGRFQQRATLAGHTERRIYSVAVSDDARIVASTSANGSLRVWDSDTEDLLEAHQLEGMPIVAISPTGKFVAVNSANHVTLWKTNADAVQALQGPGSYVYNVAWSPDGRTLVARDFLGRLVLFDALDGKRLAPVFQFTDSDRNARCAWGVTVDGTHAIRATDQGKLFAIDLVSGNAEVAIPRNSGGQSDTETARRAFLRETGRLASDREVSLDSRVRFARRSASQPDHETDPTGRIYADPWQLRLHDATTGEIVRTLVAPDAKRFEKRWDGTPPVDASFSPNGSRVAITRPDSGVLIFDCATGALITELTGHTSTLYSVAWSLDGKRIATSSNDRTIRIWDGATYEPLAVLRGHDSYVKDLAWSPNGQSLASASGDGTVRIWSTRSIADRTELIRIEFELREQQRAWVQSLFAELDDPHQVAGRVRAAADLSEDERHAALRVVRELANAWWEKR